MQQRWLNLSGPTRIAVSTSLLIAFTVGLLLVKAPSRPTTSSPAAGRGPSAEVIAQDFGEGAVDPRDRGYDGQQT